MKHQRHIYGIINVWLRATDSTDEDLTVGPCGSGKAPCLAHLCIVWQTDKKHCFIISYHYLSVNLEVIRI